MALVPLKRSPADRKSQEAKIAKAGPMVDQYPYGCALDLSAPELKKLGVKELPEIGDEYTIRAKGKVTRVSANEHQGGGDHSLCIQLTHLELTHQDAGKETADEDRGESRSRRPVTALANPSRGTRT